jgi:hypothetical protein
MSTGSSPGSHRPHAWRAIWWAALAAGAPALCACSASPLQAVSACPTATFQTTITQKVENEIDFLFMIDDSPSMASMQQKLLAQLPIFMQVLQNLPMGPPSLHVAVISSDMGAHSDASIGCTELGDNGAFHYAPEGMCTDSTLTAGSTYISDVNGMANFTDSIGTVFECIALLGSAGCGFEHQLASIDRALGADGLGAPPSTTADFLRPEAYLGIVMLTNEDDASAPENTTIFSLNGQPQNITNPDGPLANYRRNGGPRGTHLCQDPTATNPTAYITEPVTIPPDAQGPSTAPTLNLVNCKDNDSGSNAFYPVSKFVSDIQSLKSDPSQIFVAGIIGPVTPVEVGWYPATGSQDIQPGELWPAEMHSCGAQGGDKVSPNATQFTTDGSFGDPGIRLMQFITSFPNSVVGSICDSSYASALSFLTRSVALLITPPCITGSIATDAQGQPRCTVIEEVTMGASTTQIAIPNCYENENVAPCWNLVPSVGDCEGQSLTINNSSEYMQANALNATINCALQEPPTSDGGCEILPNTTEP